MIPALLMMMAPAVTFHADVEPILQRRCQTCHRPGESGPVSLMTYQEVRPNAKAIQQAIQLKRMPPWYGAQGGPFANHPELTAAEIATIDAWVTAGAKEGDRRAAPPPVHWSPGWSMPRPGLVLTAPKAFEVPARGDVDYQVLILPLYLLEDRWVSAAEIRPGVRQVVHHIVAYVREPGSAWLQDAPRGQYVRASGPATAEILAVYTPGQTPFQAPAGMAKKIPAGSDLVLEFHYMADGKAEKDQTSIGLSFSKEPPRKRILTLQLNATTFRIPPMEANYRVSVPGTLPNDALLLSLFPHMHRRGKAFEYEIDGGEGRAETLLHVAPYRFNWQMNYVLAAPRLLKKGTRLRATAWYDNSPGIPGIPTLQKKLSTARKAGPRRWLGISMSPWIRGWIRRRSSCVEGLFIGSWKGLKANFSPVRSERANKFYDLGMAMRCWFRYLVLSGGLVCAPVGAQPGKEFRIDGLHCKGLACELREGWQAGLTTVEVEGTYRGVDSVRLEVVRRDVKR